MSERTRMASASEKRMKWWHEARYGMFIHYGLYSQLARGEWVMLDERIPVAEYEKLAPGFRPRKGAAAEWAALAKKAGMKYIVLTAKHHEGFCLWDTKQTDYKATNYGAKRDLVREYVKACRKQGLKVGLYYSLMDWHHPDGERCAKNEAARKRFVEFTHGCVRELMSNYGKIDVLWYDMPFPLATPELWESERLNGMVRELQPGIIINNRSRTDEDFGTPEQHITPEKEGRAWESCMTLTGGVWGWRADPAEDWASPRAVIKMLQQVTAGGGNILLNIGPKPDGSVPRIAEDCLVKVGRWLRENGEAVYGRVDRVTADKFPVGLNFGKWTLKGKVAYFWCTHWQGKRLVIVQLQNRIKGVRLLASGKRVRVKQEPGKIVFEGLSAKSPDKIAQMTVFRMELEGEPRRERTGRYGGV